MAAPLVEIFKHNLWANLRLLDACANLDAEVLDADAPGTAGSVRDTLVHIIALEGFYLDVLHEAPHDRLRGFPGFEELRHQACTTGEGLIAFAAAHDPNRIVRGVYRGRSYAISIAIPLVQAVNHATEHRAHVNVILTQQGIEPPILDGWLYNRQAAET